MINKYVSCDECGGLFDCSHDNNCLDEEQKSSYRFNGEYEESYIYIIYKYKCPYCKKEGESYLQEE